MTRYPNQEEKMIRALKQELFAVHVASIADRLGAFAGELEELLAEVDYAPDKTQMALEAWLDAHVTATKVIVNTAKKLIPDEIPTTVEKLITSMEQAHDAVAETWSQGKSLRDSLDLPKYV